jgi:TonB family protein
MTVLRGLPYSIVVHVVLLAVVIVYGAHVPAPPLKPQHLIRVRLSQLPARQAAPAEQPASEPQLEQSEEPPPETATEPKQEPPEPEPRKVPEKQPQQKEVPPREQTAPKPVDKPPSEPAATQQAAEQTPASSEGPGEPILSGTDEPFPFAWYLDIVKSRITRHWNPAQIGIREGSERSCAVHFVIESSGAVTRTTLVSSSGIPLLDREGLRAVQAAHPLPPLPRGFASRSLGVTFVFLLRSGP